MERIEPQHDHEQLQSFQPGCPVTFKGKPYIVQSRTTLASGEAAVVLQSDTEQFMVGARDFLAGLS